MNAKKKFEKTGVGVRYSVVGKKLKKKKKEKK